jgi:hypothetical protein
MTTATNNKLEEILNRIAELHKANKVMLNVVF